MKNSDWSRREVLQAGAAGVALSALSASPRAESAEAAPEWIDAHSHIWTRDVARFPLAAGATLADLDPPSFTTEELLATAAREKVGRVVLIAHTKFYAYDNAYLIDAAARHPGKFSIVAAVDDLRPHPDVEMKRLKPQHVRGFRITSWARKAKWLDGPGMEAMWRCGAAERQAMCCLIDPWALPSVAKMCERFHETPVVIDHFARIGVDGQIRDEDLRQLCALARFERTYVKVSAFYALGRKQPPYDDLIPMIRRVYDAFGPQRLMWASDAPYQIVAPHTYRASLELVRDRLAFLSAGDREWLLRKTAERVYFG